MSGAVLKTPEIKTTPEYLKQRRETLYGLSKITGIDLKKVLKLSYKDIYELSDNFWVQFLSPHFAPIITLLGKTGSGKSAFSIKLVEVFLDVHPNGRVIILSAPSLKEEIKDPRVVIVQDIVTPYLFNEPSLAQEAIDKIREYLDNEEENSDNRINTILEEILEEDALVEDIPKLFICDESIVSLNNKDWASKASKMTEKFFAIKRHLSATLVFIAQTTKINSTAIEMTDFVVLKRCNLKLVKKLEKVSEFVKEYKHWILKCPIDGYIIDDGNTTIETSPMPQSGRIPLPRAELWNQNVSKAYGKISYQQFLEMTGTVEKEDEEPERKKFSFTEEQCILITLEHASHTQEKLYGKSFGINEIFGMFTQETMSKVSKQTVRDNYNLIKQLVDSMECPICNKDNPEIINDWKEMGYEEYKVKRCKNIRYLLEETDETKKIKRRAVIPKKLKQEITDK